MEKTFSLPRPCRAVRLIIVDPLDEAERKRVDYQVAKHGASLRLVRGNANWILTDSDDVTEVVRELSAKLAPERIKVYRLEPVDVEVEQTTRSLQMEFPAARSAVETLLVGFLMGKRKGQLQPGATATTKTYAVFTNKGRAEIRVVLTGSAQKCKVTLEVSGVKATVDFLTASLEKELELFRRGMDA